MTEGGKIKGLETFKDGGCWGLEEDNIPRCGKT